MSGGSHNYLCYADESDISILDLAFMAQRLRELGHPQIAEDTLTVGALVENPSYVIPEKLRQVWKAVEWVDRCDWLESDIPPYAEKYLDSLRT